MALVTWFKLVIAEPSGADELLYGVPNDLGTGRDVYVAERNERPAVTGPG